MQVEAIKICCHDGEAFYAMTDADVRRFAENYARIEGRRITLAFNCPQFLVDHLEVVKHDPRTIGILRRQRRHRKFFKRTCHGTRTF